MWLDWIGGKLRGRAFRDILAATSADGVAALETALDAAAAHTRRTPPLAKHATDALKEKLEEMLLKLAPPGHPRHAECFRERVVAAQYAKSGGGGDVILFIEAFDQPSALCSGRRNPSGGGWIETQAAPRDATRAPQIGVVSWGALDVRASSPRSTPRRLSERTLFLYFLSSLSPWFGLATRRLHLRLTVC